MYGVFRSNAHGPERGLNAAWASGMYVIAEWQTLETSRYGRCGDEAIWKRPRAIPTDVAWP